MHRGNARSTESGRLGATPKVNPCYRCRKSAGLNYWSDERSDTVDSVGNHWGDIALVLCESCAKHLHEMPDAAAFAEMQRCAQRDRKEIVRS